MNKNFKEFTKTGKVKDFLLYRYELAKEFKENTNDSKKRGDNPKSNGLPRK